MQAQINIQFYKSIFGELIIGSFQNKLCLCDWRYRKKRNEIDQRIQSGLNATYIESTDLIIETTINELREYEQGKRQTFDIALLFVGTAFQKQVWQQLREIKYGTTKTYRQLSESLNNKHAIRAVAAANGANAISIIVPCHRVIGSRGELTGYAGGIQSKRKLLKLEEKVSGTGQLEIFE